MFFPFSKPQQNEVHSIRIAKCIPRVAHTDRTTTVFICYLLRFHYDI